MTVADWAMAEAAGARLGDRRRNVVLGKLWTRLLGSAGRSFPAAMGDALRQAASLLFHRPGLTCDDLLAGHYQATAERCAAEPLVLVSQDSTSFNHTSHRATCGLGRLAGEQERVELLADPTLIEEFEDFEEQDGPTGKPVFRAPDRKHDDIPMACAMAARGMWGEPGGERAGMFEGEAEEYVVRGCEAPVVDEGWWAGMVG